MFKYIKEKSRGAKGTHSLRIARGRASDKLCTSPTMKVGSASGRPILPILALTAVLCLPHCDPAMTMAVEVGPLLRAQSQRPSIFGSQAVLCKAI